MKDPDENPAKEVDVETRWWIDTGKGSGKRGSGRPRPSSEERILGESIFAVGQGFDEDRARSELSDSSMSLIRDANPEPGEWGYLSLVESRAKPEQLEKTRKFLKLPPSALGVLVDSGISIRAIATGDPPGEKVVELRLGKESSFDAWNEGEWVQERVFRDRHRALREGTRLISLYLKNRDL